MMHPHSLFDHQPASTASSRHTHLQSKPFREPSLLREAKDPDGQQTTFPGQVALEFPRYRHIQCGVAITVDGLGCGREESVDHCDSASFCSTTTCFPNAQISEIR